MAKQPKNPKPVPRNEGVATEVRPWRRHLSKLWLAIFAGSLAAVCQVYQSWLSSAIEQHATAIWAVLSDKPMPEGNIIRLDFRFGMPENVHAEKYERTRVTLWPARCRRGAVIH